jgi:quercetin dioxygenase-like cupin family protein
VGAAARVIPIEDLRRSPSAVLFEGGDDVALSVFVTEFARDEGPALHTHPYPEVFLVESGTGAFTLGDEERTVTGGHVLVVPALMPHGFKGAGDDTLRVVSIHPSGTTEQTTWVPSP